MPSVSRHTRERVRGDWLLDAPAFQAWQAFVESDTAPFTIPGHKRRAATLDPWLHRLLDADVPLYGGLDTVKLSGGVLERAERLGAELWGADWCRYSTGGSTHANQALILALGQPGDTVVVSRSAHRSTVLGLVLAGLRPAWIPVDTDSIYAVPVGTSPGVLDTVLAEHPDAVAVLCVEPSYLGTTSDVAGLAAVAHGRDVPIVVDQAWGAHFGFSDGYPPHALAAGADAMVVSAHKTLPAFSQASVVAARTERLDADRLERAFEAAHTSSPAGAILASIDASRALLAHPTGVALLAELAASAARLRTALGRAGLFTLSPDLLPRGRFDPAKLVVTAAPSGHSGLELETELQRRGIPVEMADRDTVVPQLSLLDDSTSLGRLETALVEAARTSTAQPRAARVAAQWRHDAPQLLTPREAFFAAHEVVRRDVAEGRVSTELVAPYPPGIPILVPGEQITAGSLAALTEAVASGARIAYAADSTLRTLQVVARP
jgi:arginine decarboxylase